MIETKEHYRQLLENIYNPDAPDAVDAVEELIEALREVARAAKDHKFLTADELVRALPEWIVDE